MEIRPAQGVVIVWMVQHAGFPADGWPGIQSVVEGLEPVASQALLASFRSAMAAAVAEELDSQLDGRASTTRR